MLPLTRKLHLARCSWVRIEDMIFGLSALSVRFGALYDAFRHKLGTPTDIHRIFLGLKDIGNGENMVGNTDSKN